MLSEVVKPKGISTYLSEYVLIPFAVSLSEYVLIPFAVSPLCRFLRWLLSAAAPGEDVATLVINPRREGRHEPRVVKDLQDTYRKMTLPRARLRRRLDLAKR